MYSVRRNLNKVETAVGFPIFQEENSEMETDFQKQSRLASLGRIFIVILMFMATGCATQPVAETGSISIPTVAVLINHQWVEEDHQGLVWEVRKVEQEVEERFAACVRQAAASNNVPVKVITGTEFRTIIFPDLDPRSAPRSMEILHLLIPDQRFQKRIQDGHIDFIAVLGGETRTSETKGGIFCGGGFGAGACLGTLWWDHESHGSALVINMQSGIEHLQKGDDASGTSWFAMLAIIPVAAPSLHETKACENFGRSVVQSLGEMLQKGE